MQCSLQTRSKRATLRLSVFALAPHTLPMQLLKTAAASVGIGDLEKRRKRHMQRTSVKNVLLPKTRNGHCSDQTVF